MLFDKTFYKNKALCVALCCMHNTICVLFEFEVLFSEQSYFFPFIQTSTASNGNCLPQCSPLNSPFGELCHFWSSSPRIACVSAVSVFCLFIKFTFSSFQSKVNAGCSFYTLFFSVKACFTSEGSNLLY